jgi:peptidyl-prolyl cis-trans isomerase SurA
MTARRLTLVSVLGAAALLAGCKGPAPVLPPLAGDPGSLLLKPAAVPSAPPDQAVIDRVVAVVNDDVILMSELQEAVLLYLRDNPRPTAGSEQMTELQHRLLQRMVDQRLQVQEARREKIEVTEDEVRQMIDDFVARNGGDREKIGEQIRAQGLTWEQLRRDLRDSLLAQKIRGRRISRRAAITEAEVDVYVAENRPKLERDLKYHPRHIAILAEPSDSTAAWERAQADVDALEARLRQGADFAELAREYSKDGSAETGGDLGWLAPGELQASFEEAILKLAKGQVTPPLRSSNGFHVFRLEEREEVTPEMLA